MTVTITKNQTPADKSGAEAVRDKWSRLLHERQQLRERWQENTAALRKCVDAGQLFGVEIALPPDVDAQNPAVQGTLFKPDGDITIREAVLEQLKAAGKQGMKAGRIREIIEKRLGRKLHDKTVGMTLYRLAEKGFAMRDGYVWHYVP